jgi:hypothetical protein
MDITNSFVESPFSWTCVGFLFLLAITIVCEGNNYFAMNEQTDRDFFIWDDPVIIEYDKHRAAEQYLLMHKNKRSMQPLRVQYVEDWQSTLIYS